MNKAKIKKALETTCKNIITERITRFQNSLREAQEAANLETSSSAGDKYNTDRAMMQIEREKYATQLSEAQVLAKSMSLVNIAKERKYIESGSVAETNFGNYFIAVGLGKIEIDETTVFAVSPASPIGQQLIGKKAEDSFELNGKHFTILQIY